MRNLVSMVLLGLILISCDKNENTSGAVTGIVKDELTQATIAGASVSIDRISKSTETAADGSFTITDIPAGTYSVDVSNLGYIDARKTVSIASGQTAETSIEMTRFAPVLSPESLTLTTTKQSDKVSLENPGDAQLTLLVTSTQTWLTVDQTSISLAPAEKKDMIVTVDLSSLDYGEYEEELTITYDGYTSTIPVSVIHAEQADIVWQNWYLSVPIDNGSGKATSIFYEDIISGNLTQEEKEYFDYDDITGSYVMWTKFTGYTTSGTAGLADGKYCRTELREYWRGVQDTNDNWFFNVGETHEMESTLNVDFVEGTRDRTFIAQIHGKKSTIPGIDNGPATVKVLWDDGEIEVEYYVAPANPNGEWTSDDNAKSTRIRVDNEKFTIKLKVVDGVLSWGLICEAKGVNQEYVELYDYASNGYHYDNYFKTGNYFQWNSDYEQSAQVRLYKVTTNHQ